jgi:endonuclease/exonuclease/phosphatase family metal-dependent hydrolase
MVVKMRNEKLKMKKFFLIQVAICCFLLGCNRKSIPDADHRQSEEITVLCYNIHHANPPSKPGLIDVIAIANVIKQQQPQLVALQELDVHTKRSGTKLHELKALGRLTGMYYYFFKTIDYDGGEYGIGILSKYKLGATRGYHLPTAAGTNGEPRGLATAEVELPNHKKILFASTHLDAQRNDTNRVLQIKAILEILKKETRPVIIAGDFNADPASAVVQQLDSYFTRTCITGCGFTIPETRPTKTIDFIAFSPSTAFSVTDHKVIDEKYASDHLPVRAVLKIK